MADPAIDRATTPDAGSRIGREARAASLALHLGVDRSSDRPLWVQLRESLVGAVEQEVLRPGDVLPSTRVLADELGLARSTVVEAYAQLSAEGWFTAKRGSETRVAVGNQGASPAGEDRRPPMADLIDLRPGLPDLRGFPRSLWRAALVDAVTQTATRDLGYLDPAGLPLFREVVAAHLRRTRGVAATSDTVVATHGVVQGQHLAIRALTASGHTRLAVEDPLNATLRRLLAQGGLPLVAVPVDREGIDVDALARSGARAVVVTAAHQYPTGVTMTARRRAALLAWARDVDGQIVEDDYAAEFQLAEDRLPALQHGSADRVTYLGSASKTLAPGVRLGWAVPSGPLAVAFRAEKLAADHGNPVFDQVAFALLVRSGRYQRHLRAQWARYRRRRELAVRLLEAERGWRVDGGTGGLHLWVELPDGVDDEEVAAAARRWGVVVSAGSSLTVLGHCRPHLAIGYGAPSDAELAEGVRRLRSAAAGLAASAHPSALGPTLG
ncbi:GntR family transcriptional regulator / MocR family aminotransferase [Quadrisphaera granulorum]|uniref:GntR family transcriptional regulator/MocR family aminotransferase n=1 Tax=Quadrisphaera granulorum TaxID=317664 RepID=A0A316A2B1_9ACTN|nr:PLP-dependent aminotransferase family protein [Quadrisphaera granulorum]PWJ51785.1 GntR family transcriptional regulator/MocR family aminotransferase [Quadrisphaera granulorum]SZE97732.1 GntR family transcriptional regulator / MocR family aminotransferase [Quadrisphaera granulorum]